MSSNKRSRTSHTIPRWLAVAGLAGSLLIPLSARADHQGNDAAEILVSAAVAYAVIDAVGGFEDRDRHKHRRHAHARHGRYDHRWEHDRRHWSRHDHRRHDKHERHHKHRRHHDRYWAADHHGRGHYHHRRDGRRYWCVSYH